MKRIIYLALSLLLPSVLYADSCTSRLIPTFTPLQATLICKNFGQGQLSTETVASAGSVQGNGPLSATLFIHIVTGFDETKVVTLPAATATGDIGKVHIIYNSVSNKFAKIFPNTGAQINTLGANTAYTSGATGIGGKSTMCVVTAANQWSCG